MPEILDHLPAEDPRAVRSRRDLARINGLMRQPAILARALATLPVPRTIADLGGGDGRLMLAVARRLPWRGVTLLVCDRQDIVAPETRRAFAALDWRIDVRRGDIFDALPPADIITANLFLHHFDQPALARLLALASGAAPAFVACEPRRSLFALLGAHLVWALGANSVTRHDAVASVRAGFAGHDLSALWPPGWAMQEQAVFPFTHLFRACSTRR